jgi:uncharacterized protein YlxW (UPF0749 family)
MLLTPSQMWRAKRCCSIGLRAALLIKILLVVNVVCFAQTDNTPPAATKPSVDKPLTSDERAELLKLIRSLQERVEKLEAGQSNSEKAGSQQSRLHPRRRSNRRTQRRLRRLRRNLRRRTTKISSMAATRQTSGSSWPIPNTAT